MADSVNNKSLEEGGDRTLWEQLFRQLSDAIVAGELPPGSKLSEPVLAKRFGVSRGPLREAINRLQERRLVTRTAHFGARVTELSPRILEEAYTVREALEGMAARLAAINGDNNDLEALRRAYARHVAAVREGGEGPVWRSADEDFHVIIARASRNPMLVSLLTEDFYQLVRFFRSQLVHVRGRGDRTVAEHRRILEAIEDRDGDLAELHMRRHIAAARAQLSQALSHQVGSEK